MKRSRFTEEQIVSIIQWLFARLEPSTAVSIESLPHADVAIVLGRSVGQPLR